MEGLQDDSGPPQQQLPLAEDPCPAPKPRATSCSSARSNRAGHAGHETTIVTRDGVAVRKILECLVEQAGIKLLGFFHVVCHEIVPDHLTRQRNILRPERRHFRQGRRTAGTEDHRQQEQWHPTKFQKCRGERSLHVLRRGVNLNFEKNAPVIGPLPLIRQLQSPIILGLSSDIILR